MSAQVRLPFLALSLGAILTTTGRAEPLPCQPVAPPSTLLDRHGDPLPTGAIARIGTVRWRHPFAFFVGFSGDGRTLTSVGGTEFRVWDNASGRMLRRVPVTPAGICAAAMSPDGNVLAVSPEDALGREGTVVSLWDVATGKQLRRIKTFGEPVVSLAFSPDGKRLASCGWCDSSVRLWDAATGEPLAEFVKPTGEPDSVGDRQGIYVRSFSLAFSPDGKHLVTSTERGIVRLWRVSDGKVVWSAKGQERTPNGVVAFSPDGRMVAWETDDKEICLAEAATGKELRRVEGFHNGVSHLAWSPDCRVLAAAPPGGTVRIWDPATGKKLGPLQGSADGESWLAFSPNSKTLAGSFESCLRRWDVNTGNELADPGEPFFPVGLLAFSPDGEILATQDTTLTILLRQARTGKVLSVVDHSRKPGVCLVFSADGKSLLSQVGDFGLQVWDLSTGQEKITEYEAGRIHAAWFSPDGSTISAGTSQGVAVQWDVRSGDRLRVIDSPIDCQEADFLKWSGDGQLLCLVRQTQVRTVATFAGKEHPLCEVTAGLVEGATVSGDNMMLALWVRTPKTVTLKRKGTHQVADPAAPGAFALFEVVTGKERSRLTPVPPEISELTFSPNGRWLAFVASDTVHVWDVSTGSELRQFHGDQGGVYKLAFSPDSRLLAAAGFDTTVLVWDLTSLHEDNVARRPLTLSADQLETLWADLADTDAAKAFRAANLLVRSSSSLGFLEKKLKQDALARQTPRKEILRWIANLDDDAFTVREEASGQLDRLGDKAETMLRQALTGKLSLEARRRVERLLEKHQKAAPASDNLRAIRAVEVLERVASPEARELLKTLSSEPTWPLLAAEADAAQARLTKIPKKGP
jgi:WD40 repeat protein